MLNDFSYDKLDELNKGAANYRKALCISKGAAARVLRLEKGVGLRELARRMGVSAPFVLDLENGNRNWNRDVEKRYMEALQ